MELTRRQVADRKRRAVVFVTHVLNDPQRAAEIAEEELEHYAARRKIRLLNPRRRRLRLHPSARRLGIITAELIGDFDGPGDDGDVVQNPAVRAEYSFGGSDLGWLALVLDERGQVVLEYWAIDRDELLSWLADHASGLPVEHVIMAAEPDEAENPERFRHRLLARAGG